MENLKIPPHDTDVEKVVIGSLLVEEDAIHTVSGILRPEHLYNDSMRLIYKAILELDKKGDKVDLYTVIEQLTKTNDIDRVGGAYEVAQLTELVGSAAHLEYHCKILIDKASRRQLAKQLIEVYEDCFDMSKDIEDILSKADKTVISVTDNYTSEQGNTIKEILPDVISNIEKAGQKGTGISGIETGFPSLDHVTQGWQNTDMIVIAARPSMGKTAFTLSMAVNMAKLGYKILIFSLEMSKAQIVNRILAMETELNSSKLRSGLLSSDEWTTIDQKIAQIENLGIIIDDEAAISELTLKYKCRQYKKKYNFDIIMIDYLQLMHSSQKLQSREREVAEISSATKTIAKELNIPVIALSQLNRAVETRQDKKPTLADLRDSGSIEQDADIVCFIHRPEKYGIEITDDGEPTQELGQIIIAKNRNGEVRDVNLRFRAELAKFEEW